MLLQVVFVLRVLIDAETYSFSVPEYAKKMLAEGAWGGGIELICFSQTRRVNVHVYRVI